MQVVGLYKEEQEFQIACLSEQKGQVVLELLERREAPLSFSRETVVPDRKTPYSNFCVKDPRLNRKKGHCIALIQRAFRQLKPGNFDAKNSMKDFCGQALVVAGVDGHDLLIRQLRSPLRKKQALHKTLPFQLEALIPYSLDEVIVKPIYIREKEETLGTFFTVPKKFFEKFLHTYQERGMDPEWVSVVPMALLRFGEFTCPDAPSLVIFHVGKIRTQIISVKMGMIESHLTLPMGAQ
ncbi:MAG: hypothetical protein KDK69_00420, partial [Chlamydiia bacterium]|nr:hypothetical protein [Chlamydiia bacterium]